MATSTKSRSGERGAPAKTSGDQARPTAPRATLPSVNPYNGQTLKTYLEMSAEDVDIAIAKAHERFPAWRRVPFAQRASLLHRAAALCRERVEELARLMALEMGKRIAEGREEVKLCARIFEYYARIGARNFCGPRPFRRLWETARFSTNRSASSSASSRGTILATRLSASRRRT